MISSNFTSLKTLSPNAVALVVGASTYELVGGGTSQSVTEEKGHVCW